MSREIMRVGRGEVAKLHIHKRYKKSDGNSWRIVLPTRCAEVLGVTKHNRAVQVFIDEEKNEVIIRRA